MQKDRQWMPGVPRANTRDLPPANDLPERAFGVQESLIRTKWEQINRIHHTVGTNIINAPSSLARETECIFWSVGLATADGTIVDRMRPNIIRLERPAV